MGPVQGRGEGRIVGRYCERFHLQRNEEKEMNFLGTILLGGSTCLEIFPDFLLWYTEQRLSVRGGGVCIETTVEVT